MSVRLLFASLVASALVACAGKSKQSETPAPEGTPGELTVQSTPADPSHLPSHKARIEAIEGEVEIKSGKKFVKVEPGQEIALNEVVSTGKKGRAKLVMPDGNEVTVLPETQLEVLKHEAGLNKKTLINLMTGKVRAHVKNKYLGQDSFFQIKTQASAAGVRGTDFLTSYSKKDKTTQVVTFEGNVEFGAVGVNGAITNPVVVAAGQGSEAVDGQLPAKPTDLSKEQLEKLNVSNSIAKSETVAATTVEAPKVEAAPVAVASKTSVTAETSLKWLKNGNVRFTKRRLRADGQGKKDIARVVASAHPHALILSSSDSRIPPEIIFDQKLGEIYVVRSPLQGLDEKLGAALEGKVGEGLQHIVVLGSNGPEKDFWSNPKAIADLLVARSNVFAKAIEQGHLKISVATYDLNTGVVGFE